jgi:hypothetical protein
MPKFVYDANESHPLDEAPPAKTACTGTASSACAPTVAAANSIVMRSARSMDVILLWK